jgi:hypothetical protein
MCAAVTDASAAKRFYTPGQITWAAFLGGPLAGFWFISKNFLFLNEPEKAKTAIAYGVAASFVLGAIVLVLNKIFPHFSPDEVLPFAYAGAVGAYARTVSLPLLSADAALKGSTWHVFGLGSALMIPTIGLMAVPSIISRLATGGH